MTGTQNRPEVLKERMYRCLEMAVLPGIPLLIMGAMGILLMSEGEETRAADSVIPIWGSWLFIWWCFTTLGCLLGCFLWRKRLFRRLFPEFSEESKAPDDTVREAGADPAPDGGADVSGAPPEGRRKRGYVIDFVMCAVVALMLSGAIVWAWPDPYAYYWRPIIRTLLDDHKPFVRRRIRISGIVRADALWYPNADKPGGERWMILDDEGATIKIYYNQRDATEKIRIGDRVEIVGYVFDRGPGPWSFKPARIYRVD